MTLEETIKRYKKHSECIQQTLITKVEAMNVYGWLKELKAYREADKEIEQELVNWNDIDNGKCRGLFLATSIIQHYKDGEVNADDNIQS